MMWAFQSLSLSSTSLVCAQVSLSLSLSHSFLLFSPFIFLTCDLAQRLSELKACCALVARVIDSIPAVTLLMVLWPTYYHL